MNDRMWANAATQANLELLRERGVEVLAPATGRLATAGEWGTGRLPEPAELLAAVQARLAGGSWSGTRTLVTAGGTREPIDAVRYVGNRSSGRMGFALADAAAARGSEVVVVAANVALARAPGIRYVDVSQRRRAGGGLRGRVRRRRRARDVRRGGRLPSGRAGRRQAREGRGGDARARARGHRRRARGALARAAATGRRWSASPPSTAPARSGGRARSSPASGSTRSSATTSPSPGSALTPSATR